MITITPAQAVAISLHLEQCARDVCFYGGPDSDEAATLVFCDIVEKNKNSDWDFIEKFKIDAEIYLYSIAPEIGGFFEVYSRQFTPRKLGSIYRILEIQNRILEGFGLICACEEVL